MNTPGHVTRCVGLLAAFALTGVSQTREAGEYELKAAMIASVLRLVDWPPRTEPQGALRVCVANAQELEIALTETFAKSKSAGGRRAIAVRARGPVTAEQCDAVFLAGSDRKKIGAALRGIGTMPILTIGENDRFTADGGMIGLVLEDDRLQVEVNLQSSRTAGLTISSRLLRVASVKAGGAL